MDRRERARWATGGRNSGNAGSNARTMRLGDGCEDRARRSRGASRRLEGGGIALRWRHERGPDPAPSDQLPCRAEATPPPRALDTPQRRRGSELDQICAEWNKFVRAGCKPDTSLQTKHAFYRLDVP